MQGNDNPDSSAARILVKRSPCKSPSTDPLSDLTHAPSNRGIHVYPLPISLPISAGRDPPAYPLEIPLPVRRTIPWPGPRFKLNELEVPLEARRAG